MTRRLKPGQPRGDCPYTNFRPPARAKKMDANNVMSGFRHIKLPIANSAHPER
jgi:hypothetical protein